MKTTRKLMVGLVAAAGLATAGAIAYAFPPGYGPGSGACPYYGAGPGAMGFGGGPGAMGFGGGPGAMGWGGGPGAMGWGGRGPMGWGGGPGHMWRSGYGPGAGAGPAANADTHLSFLKSELKITSGQEGAWDAYAKQVKAQAAAMWALHSQAASAAQSAPDRFARRAEFAKQRAASVEAVSAAVKDLYAALTPEQKAVADQYFGGWGPGAYGGTRGYGRRGFGPAR